MNTYFLVYLIGYGLIIAGVWFGMGAAGIGSTWKIVAVLILMGMGIIYAFSKAQTDTAQREQARGTGAQSGGQGGSAPQQGQQGSGSRQSSGGNSSS